MSETIDLQDPTAVHEAVVADRLLDLRDQFYVLAINWDYVRESRTGERLSPKQRCLCPNCSEKVEAILYGEVDDLASPQYFCDGCFDESWRSHVEEKLTEEFARDYS